MIIRIEIKNIQHIEKQKVTIDLSKNKITCIAGKNGIGKTTLLRSIRNLSVNSTFQETAAPYIFNKNSSITYSISTLEDDIVFTYNRFIKGIDSKQEIPSELKSAITVEMAIPHGERFSHFRRLADIDSELRAKIALGAYTRPNELIRFLEKVYTENRFEDLKEVTLKNTTFYFILKDEEDRFYVREDYFSSGEYFVINLYKQIKKDKKLIVIDEIDISLDASAQVNLVKVLRELCINYNTNIVFTTHSLALMETLEAHELYFMEPQPEDNLITINPRSFNFIKTVMYGFQGKDRYILTEDKCLEEYISYTINNSGKDVFFLYQVIYIAGGSQVMDLIVRNSKENFLTQDENILAVLDGDQEKESYLKALTNYALLPFPSIEKEVYFHYESGHPDIPRVGPVKGKNFSKKSKSLFKNLTRRYLGEQLMSKEAIYRFLEKEKPEAVEQFRSVIIEFLNP